jgi:glutaredoxin
MIYVIGKDDCPWCDKAKELLDNNNTQYVYKNLSTLFPSKREAWKNFINNELAKTTVPVVINVVGGYSELSELMNG